jgi:hypothetical protein
MDAVPDNFPVGEHPPGMTEAYRTGQRLGAEVFTRSGVHAVLGAADAVAAEVERLRADNASLQCRVDELTAGVDELEIVNTNLQREVERLLADVIRARSERDDWRAKAGT